MAQTELKVSIALANQPGYDILVRPGLLAEIGPWLRTHSKATKVVVVTDKNVEHRAIILRLHLSNFGINAIVATLPPGENHKTLSDLLPIYDRILSAGIERTTPVLAIGGGVVGDMAGFVAATLLRGVPFVQIPTTLLAMVDASVGGKTGVNSAAGKNLIGAFHQPIGVLIDPQALTTLPNDELRGGLAECIKHEVIRDAHGFARLESDIGKALALNMDYLTR